MNLYRFFLKIFLINYLTHSAMLLGNELPDLVMQDISKVNLIKGFGKNESIVYMKQIDAFMESNGLDTIYSHLQHFHTRFLANADSTMLDEKDLYALISYASVLSAVQVKEVEKIVKSLENAKFMWQISLSSKIPYFFRISPRKWLSKADEKMLAAGYIKEIDHYIDIYTNYLGSVFLYYQDFVTKDKDQFDFAWLVRLINLLAKPFASVQSNKCDTPIEALEMTMALVDLIPKFAKTDIPKLLRNKTFGHFERNWFPYLLGTLAFAGASYLVINNSKEIAQGIGNFHSSAKNHAQHAYQAIRSILGLDRKATIVAGKGGLLGGGIKKIQNGLEELQAVLSEKELNSLESEFLRQLGEQTDDSERAKINAKIQKLKEIRLAQEALGRGIKQFGAQGAKSKELGMARDFATERNVLRQILKERLNQEIPTSEARWYHVRKDRASVRDHIIEARFVNRSDGALTRDDIAKALDREVDNLSVSLAVEVSSYRGVLNAADDVKFLGRVVALSFSEMTEGTSFLVKQAGEGTAEIIAGMDEAVENINENIEFIIDQNKWTMSMVVLAPVTVMGIVSKYVVSGISKWFDNEHRKNLKARITALTDVLFAASNSQMTPLIKGKVVYLVNELRNAKGAVRQNLQAEYESVLDKMLFVDDTSALRDMIFYLSWHFSS